MAEWKNRAQVNYKFSTMLHTAVQCRILLHFELESTVCPLLAGSRQQSISSSGYSTRTKTGSVKRKHYDRLSGDSEHDSPRKNAKLPRKVKPPRLSESDDEDDDCSVETAVQTNGSLKPSRGAGASADATHGKDVLSQAEDDYGSDTEEARSGSDSASESVPRRYRDELRVETDTAANSSRSPSRGRGGGRPRGRGRRLQNGRTAVVERIARTSVANGSHPSSRPRRDAAYRQHYDENDDDDYDDDDDDGGDDHSYALSTSQGRRSERNRGRQTVHYDENTDDELMSAVAASSPYSQSVSSRGRLRKARGFFDES